MSDCGCNKKQASGYVSVNPSDSVAKSYTRASTHPRQHRHIEKTNPINRRVENTIINSVCNTNVWGDDFMMSFAWNDEANPETGLAISHLFPAELIGWCPKDTPERCHPCDPNIRWERKNGHLIVRDVTIKGEKNVHFSDGGQIIMDLPSQVPSCALGPGYSAHDLCGLGDAIAPYFDGVTIKRDPTNNNKFAAFPADAKESTKVYYVEQGSETKFFTYNDQDQKTYYTAGALDNKVKILTDGVTIIGNGVDIPLKVKGSSSEVNVVNSFNLVNTEVRDTTSSNFPSTGDADTNAKQYTAEERMRIIIPRSNSGKRKIFIHGFAEISFADEDSGWDTSNVRLQGIVCSVSIRALGGSLLEAGSSITAAPSDQRNILGNSFVGVNVEQINLSGIYDIQDSATHLVMNINVLAPRTAAAPKIQLRKTILNMSIL